MSSPKFGIALALNFIGFQLIFAAVTIQGSTLPQTMLPTITANTSPLQLSDTLKTLYHSMGYIYVQFHVKEDVITVHEFPLAQIEVFPPEEKTMLEQYIQLPLGQPLNRIQLEEQLAAFYQTAVFYDNYEKITIEPNIFLNYTILKVFVEKKAHTEVLLLSQDARGPGLWAQTTFEYQNNTLTWQSGIAAIVGKQFNYFAAHSGLSYGGWPCRVFGNYQQDVLFAFQQVTAQGDICLIREKNWQLAVGYRLDGQSPLNMRLYKEDKIIAHQATLVLRYGSDDYFTLSPFLEGITGYEPMTGLWRFWGKARYGLDLSQNTQLTGYSSLYTTANLVHPAVFLVTTAFAEYFTNEAVAGLYLSRRTTYLRFGPVIEFMDRGALGGALAGRLEFISETMLTTVTGGGECPQICHNYGWFLRFMAEARL